MLVDDDMTVFFSTDFASTWVRLAGVGLAPVEFPAIMGVQDVEALQGYALSTDHELAYVTGDVNLSEGQLLQQLGKPATWRVRSDPQPTADGLTSTVLIGQAPQ